MGLELDLRFFAQLAERSPGEVCVRALCGWDRARECYALDAWGDSLAVYPKQELIRPAGSDQPSLELGGELAVVFYLLQAKDLPLKGEWVSEKDLPGGEAFFRGPHEIPTGLIANRFGEDLDGFRVACEAQGGTATDLGDVAYVIRVLPRVPVAVLLWGGDDEFGAEAKLLFDRTIGEHLPLDVIFGLATELCSRIATPRQS